MRVAHQIIIRLALYSDWKAPDIQERTPNRSEFANWLLNELNFRQNSQELARTRDARRHSDFNLNVRASNKSLLKTTKRCDIYHFCLCPSPCHTFWLRQELKESQCASVHPSVRSSSSSLSRALNLHLSCSGLPQISFRSLSCLSQVSFLTKSIGIN